MRVALDVTPLIAGSTGVARYTTELRQGIERAGVEVRAFAVGRGHRPAPEGTRHLRVPLRVVQRSWAVIGRPRAETITGPVDLVHSIDLIAPPTRLPLVVTVHDLVALDRPDLHEERATRQQTARLDDAARAQVVIVPTTATADALVAHGGVRERIVVVPHGAPDLGRPTAGGADGAILAVGDLAPRKGLDVLLRAAAEMSRPTPLVLVGPVDHRLRALHGLIEELGLSERVTVLGRVDDGALAGLYRSALALCFPSRAEGFGLPVLEAMAAGLPVVASDLDVIREVTDGAARLVPVGDHHALAAALDEVARDSPRRRRMVEDGLRRAADFSWEAAAARTVHAYELALERGRR